MRVQSLSNLWRLQFDMQSGEAGFRRRRESADYGYFAERVGAKIILRSGTPWLSNGFKQECRIASPPQGQGK